LALKVLLIFLQKIKFILSKAFHSPMSPETIIKLLNLSKHPEGGYYSETYRAKSTINLENSKVRNTSTAIYYMLMNNEKSNFHKVAADESWFFHQGATIEILSITPEGTIKRHLLGNRLDLGEAPQITIPANVWFAARIKEEKGYALVSCTVAPGFEFDDFTLGKRAELKQMFPQLHSEIEKFTTRD
jgi:predicted cupin superfamily sugar epimerase